MEIQLSVDMLTLRGTIERAAGGAQQEQDAMLWFSKKDSRSVEQIIFDIAEHKRHSDIKLLISRLAGKPVFAPIPERMKEFAAVNSGKTFKADGTDRFVWPYTEIENLKFLKCLPGMDNPVCDGNAISIPFEEMKLIILKLNLDGLYIHNGNHSWCVITREDLA